MVKMTVQTSYCQKNSSTVSFSAIITVLSVLFYCAGFIRVELAINEQQKRIFKLEDVVEGLKLIANDGEVNFLENTIHGKIFFFFSGAIYRLFMRALHTFFIRTHKIWLSLRIFSYS